MDEKTPADMSTTTKDGDIDTAPANSQGPAVKEDPTVYPHGWKLYTILICLYFSVFLVALVRISDHLFLPSDRRSDNTDRTGLSSQPRSPGSQMNSTQSTILVGTPARSC